jgi:hypothetical protein
VLLSRGVRVSRLGIRASSGPVVAAALDGRRVRSIPRIENWQRKPKYPEKTCLSLISSIANFT